MQEPQRALELFKTIRCLDCDGPDHTIEFVESPISIEQRKVIRQLMRMGYNNRQIYRHFETLYGSYCIPETFLKDEIHTLRLPFQFYIGTAGLCAISLYFLRRRI